MQPVGEDWVLFRLDAPDAPFMCQCVPRQDIIRPLFRPFHRVAFSHERQNCTLTPREKGFFGIAECLGFFNFVREVGARLRGDITLRSTCHHYQAAGIACEPIIFHWTTASFWVFTDIRKNLKMLSNGATGFCTVFNGTLNSHIKILPLVRSEEHTSE